MGMTDAAGQPSSPAADGTVAQTGGTAGPGSTDEPVTRVRAPFVAGLALASLGLWTALYTPVQVLLARQLEAIDPGGKETALALVTGIGALVGLVATPLAGALSDRTASRFGRRRPWLAGGALCAAAGLALLSRQGSVASVAGAWCLAQLGLGAVLAGLVAVLPDQVPVSQRARVSAWMGAAQPVSVLLGTVLVTRAVTGTAAGYAVPALAVVTGAALFLALVKDAPPGHRPAPSGGPRHLLRGTWGSLRRHPDFALAWVTRFLIQSGNAIGTLYLLYFLRDEIRYEQRFPGRSAEQGLTVLVSLYALGIVGAAFAGAAYSDRHGRRRTPIVVAGTVIAAAALLLAVWPSWPAALAAAPLMGLGYGVYVSVDQALVTDVLPSSGDRGRDLGVTNIANVLPHVLGPLLAAALVSAPGGYRSLFTVTAVLTLAGVLLVRRIRGVR
ncbi:MULTISPECIES: MFS transporter [Streptomyces]|uniref:MFS transporter n=1 Tax=Streptomyces TaxID=1883 RepID=UPI0019ADE0B4|nr:MULTISPECIES: MFS transporter [Streptomyces]GGR90775.1 MFS transporter [Streptomyces eurythermus]